MKQYCQPLLEQCFIQWVARETFSISVDQSFDNTGTQDKTLLLFAECDLAKKCVPTLIQNTFFTSFDAFSTRNIVAVTAVMLHVENDKKLWQETSYSHMLVVNEQLGVSTQQAEDSIK